MPPLPSHDEALMLLPLKRLSLATLCLVFLVLLGMTQPKAVAEDIMVQSQPESPSPQTETEIKARY
jgi:hypothetical protein